jgi:hypothetical protein
MGENMQPLPLQDVSMSINQSLPGTITAWGVSQRAGVRSSRVPGRSRLKLKPKFSLLTVLVLHPSRVSLNASKQNRLVSIVTLTVELLHWAGGRKERHISKSWFPDYSIFLRRLLPQRTLAFAVGIESSSRKFELVVEWINFQGPRRTRTFSEYPCIGLMSSSP